MSKSYHNTLPIFGEEKPLPVHVDPVANEDLMRQWATLGMRRRAGGIHHDRRRAETDRCAQRVNRRILVREQIELICP